MKSTYIENTEKYLMSKKLPQKEFLELGVSDSFFRDNQDSPDHGTSQQMSDPSYIFALLFEKE
jgi:hypothetical protein